MAGSLKHLVDDAGNYRGVELLENMGDMHEAVEEMAYMLLQISQTNAGRALVNGARDEYYQCMLRERPWPEWFRAAYQNAGS